MRTIDQNLVMGWRRRKSQVMVTRVAYGCFLQMIGVIACPSVLPAVEDRIEGTWVLQQVSSRQQLDRLAETTIGPALETPHIRGFCLRVPWHAIDQDFALLQAGRKLARSRGVDYSIRFMAGRHSPSRLFEKGCPCYVKKNQQGRDERIPTPFRSDGSTNKVFEDEYERFVAKLAKWCRRHDVHLLHLAWYGQDWAELNHGKEVRAAPGYSYEAWLTAHKRLIDIGLKHAGPDLAVELPFSGYGPLTEAALEFVDHVIQRCGPNSGRFYCQANGWAPGGDWGAPTAETEAAFDRVWKRAFRRGQQAIQPQDFDWSAMYENLRQNRSTYCEVYAASFLGDRSEELVEELRRFAAYREGLKKLP